MIRYHYIYNQVLQLYKSMEKIAFPIEPAELIAMRDDCRILPYTKFAQINSCDIQDVIMMCESKSGCTHYDPISNRYLILWNDDNHDYNVSGRRRWTKAHELGHVVLKHMPMIAEPQLAEHGFSNLSAPELETEADHFAATLLCPMPLFDLLNISSPADIKSVFGLSLEASINRWNEYHKWKAYRRKTAWENDMRRVFLKNQ